MHHESAVRLQPPPLAVMRVLNPLLRALLLSPLGNRLPPLMAVLVFTGRRSGRSFTVPVGVHELASGPVVFTEARWRLNFAGGREVSVRRGRQHREGRGVLVEDPQQVAHALAEAIERVGARDLALRTTPGREITHDDLLALDRRMVRLELLPR